jgi:hypothetical protein
MKIINNNGAKGLFIIALFAMVTSNVVYFEYVKCEYAKETAMGLMVISLLLTVIGIAVDKLHVYLTK